MPPLPRLAEAPFGALPNGHPVRRFTLGNAHGLTLDLLDYGGTITAIHTPDRSGAFDDVVLGFDDMNAYLTRSPFFGATIGRYANRIARGRFTLDGQTYSLALNNGPNHLHGGLRGWDKVMWQAEPFEEDDRSGVRLRYVSPDGEEGYPGAVTVQVTCALTDDNDVRLDCHATANAPTIINVTQHTYFNLAGSRSDTVLDHQMQLFADQYTPVDATLIPTGELAPVAGTPFDFRNPTRIGERIDGADEQLRFGDGYDHNFVVNRTGHGLAPVARAVEPRTGRVLEAFATQPGVQFYTGNHLPAALPGKEGRIYTKRAGFCLETQHFPDSPNQPSFPPAVLRPGEEYGWTTIYRFGVE
jgi:aldose 1-epimerase